MPVSGNGVVLRGTRSNVSVVSSVVGQGVVSLSASQASTGRTVSSLSVLVASGETRADTSSMLVVLVVAGQTRGETRAGVGGTSETRAVLVVVSVVKVTGNGVGGGTSRGEVGSRVLEGLSASRADE